jgi:hypothetical protein
MHNVRMRRIGRSAALVAALAASLLVLNPQPQAAVSAAMPQVSSCSSSAPLGPGASGPEVACLQFFLSLSGLYNGELTSTYDQPTAVAVGAYQTLHPPLAANGVATVQTLTDMGLYVGTTSTLSAVHSCTADANIALASYGTGATCVQRRLTELGLYSGAVDGVFGQGSVDALKVFQSKNPPLNVDGIGGPRTLAALGIWSGASGGLAPVVAVAEPTRIAPGGPWPAPVLDYPNFALTAEGIPVYGNHRSCTLEDANTIASQFALDGADVTTQQWAVYLASREGGCNYQTVNINAATRDDSHCTFQLNALSGMFTPHGELGRRGWTTDSVKLSMQNCADAASDLWVYCGKGPWTPPYRCLQPWENDLGATGDE